MVEGIGVFPIPEDVDPNKFGSHLKKIAVDLNAAYDEYVLEANPKRKPQKTHNTSS